GSAYFVESLEPMEVTAGDAVCLKCQVAGTPEIKVSWFKADGKVRSSPTCKLEYSKGVACLKLSKATKADIGEYTCKAENRIGSASSTCRLNVLEAKTPPTFPKKITSLQQTEDQPVRFECRVAGSSPIEVSWLKDGEPLREGSEFSMTYDDNTAVLQISRGEMRHSGEYACVATNSVGSTSCRAKLTLQGLYPNGTNKKNLIGWSWMVSVILGLSFSGIFWLHFYSVRLFDAQTFKYSHLKICCCCLIFLPLFHGPSAEPRYPPVFDRKLSPQEVTVGDSIELECHMTGSAPIKVTWSKDHKDIRTGGNYKISCVENTPHLTILKADKADTGRYFCHASNDMGKDSCSSDITRKNPPVFTKKPSEQIEDMEGKLVKIEGRVSGSQPMSVSWFKDNTEIYSSDKYDISFKSNVAVLCIKSSQVVDSGRYSCQASNEVGGTKAPVFDVPLKPVTVDEGEKLGLRCHVCGTPPLKIQWMKDRKDLTSAGSTRISFSDGTACLEISSASRHDAGDYLCKATNDAGSESTLEPGQYEILEGTNSQIIVDILDLE
uniref:Ig-like domain-containing protein n=1 Tax=Dicentrarchus labrax TaxID=13489 RepID=A0A8P4GEM9_DICLA